MLARAIYDDILRIAASVAPDLHDAILRVGPIEIAEPRHGSVADRLFVEIVNQQLSTKAALAIWTRIEAAAAARGLALRAFFVAEHAEPLRTCGVSRNKIRALAAVTEAEAAGLFDCDLAAMPHAARSALLRRVRGIGPWTADMVGIFHFLDPDIWPPGDVAAVASLRRLSGRSDTDAVAALFAPYRSILARYMWQVRDTAPTPELAAV